jgi:hypothetical protein
VFFTHPVGSGAMDDLNERFDVIERKLDQIKGYL